MTFFQTKPVCQSLSVKNCCLTLHSVSGKLFFCLQSRNPSKICPVVRARRTCFLFVCEELDPYMIFCLAHFQNLSQLSKVTEFNTDLNTRDRQTSSNVCLLKLKEKQQHIKNAIRSQSMASLSQIPILNFSVCKKGKQKNATCTLDYNNPKVPLHTKGLYLYKSSENVYNNLIVRKSSLITVIDGLQTNITKDTWTHVTQTQSQTVYTIWNCPLPAIIRWSKQSTLPMPFISLTSG